MTEGYGGGGGGGGSLASYYLLPLAPATDVQYRHLVFAPVAVTSAANRLYKHPWMACQKNKPSTSVAHALVNQSSAQL